MYTNLTDEQKQLICKLKDIRPCEIIFYDMNQYDVSIFPSNMTFITSSTYYRFYIPQLLDKSIDKVLYLDADVIVEEDLKNL